MNYYNSTFKQKPTIPLKRTGFTQKLTVPLKRTKLRVVGDNDTATLKQEIQDLVRDVVIARDKGCVLRKIRNCGGEIGEAVIQADHLLTRANSATYADTRLIVCICRSCHFWKKYHKEEYDSLVKSVISTERGVLWEKCEQDSWRPKRTGSYDWKLSILALKQELKKYD